MKEYNNKNINKAKELRKNQTPHEQKLWYYLRGNKFVNYKFRRQYPIGNYIADFCCFKEKVIIELDGGQHSEQLDYDGVRDAYFKDQGYKVLRIWNNELDNNLEGALEKILEMLKHPHP